MTSKLDAVELQSTLERLAERLAAATQHFTDVSVNLQQFMARQQEACQSHVDVLEEASALCVEHAQEAVTQQRLLMDHVEVCCAKRAQVKAVALEVARLQADVDDLHRFLLAANAQRQSAAASPS